MPLKSLAYIVKVLQKTRLLSEEVLTIVITLSGLIPAVGELYAKC